MTITSFFQEFVQTERLWTPKFSAICAGGGASLALLQATPGASKFVAGMYFPYDKNVVAEEIDNELGATAAKRYMDKAVHKRVALDLAEMAHRRTPYGVGVGITAALTTVRYRLGDTHAYIGFADASLSTVYHVTFSKMEEQFHNKRCFSNEQRLAEDEALAKIAIAIIYGYDPENLMDNKESITITECEHEPFV